MESKDLTVVIVTFNSESKIINCLKTIPSDVRIIVVENSDNRKLKKDLEDEFKNLNCILTGDNKGYAVANNIGLNQVNTKYALVLNPDTILDNDAIKNFLARANELQDFWLLGPANDQMVKIKFENNNLVEVDTLKGFAIFLNISKFNDDFFDENFFLYFEEIDLCKRVKKNEGKIYLDNNIKIHHQGAGSVDKIDQFELEKNRNWHWMWSTFYYHRKYKGFILALVFILPKLLSASLKTLIYFLIFNKKKRDVYYCRLSGLFNSILGNKSWYRPS
jgi:GT2 family glycosyltransferase